MEVKQVLRYAVVADGVVLETFEHELAATCRAAELTEYRKFARHCETMGIEPSSFELWCEEGPRGTVG